MKKENRPNAPVKKQKLSVSSRFGTRLMLTVLLAFVVIVLVNTIADKLPDEYTSFDLTGRDAYTFTQQTVDICSSLNSPVTFYYIYNGSTGSDSFSSYLNTLMKRYAEASPYIRIETIDPSKNPSFTAKYTDQTVTNRSIIVDGPLRAKIVDFFDIFVVNESSLAATGSPESIQFKGEAALTSAISYVVSNEVPIVYATKGHGETVPDDGILNRVLDENYEISELALSAVDAIPDDADCLLIDCPSSDITTRELEIINKYLDAGGNLFLITDYLDERMPNIAALAARYGLSAVPGTVIETDSGMCYSGSPTSILPVVQYHTVTAPLYSHQVNVLVRGVQGLKAVVTALPAGAQAVSLFETSEGSFSRTNTKGDSSSITSYAKQADDISGPFYLGIAVTQPVENGQCKIVWLSSSDWNSDEASNSVSGGNRDVFLNVLAWTCEWEHTISIRSSSIAGGTISPSDTQRMVWGIIYPAILCISILLCGMIIWRRRRTR